MRDTWIDDHTGDETIARPDFEAELRSALAKQLAAPARRRAPWRAIGWAAAAAAALVTGVVALDVDWNDQRVVPAATTTAPTDPDTTLPGTTLPDTTPGTTTPGTTTPGIAPAAEGDTLQVPATGGPALSPALLAEFDLPDGYDTSLAALLPDRVVVAMVADGRFDATIVSFDRAGNRLPDTRLDAAPADLAGLVLGGYDGTLYLETYPEVENTQTTKAYVLDGDVWREVGSYFVEQNNDGMYSVTGDGLTLGDTLVIPAQTVTDSATVDVRYPGELQVFEVVRTTDRGTTTWRVEEEFENFSLPPVPTPFAGGVIFTGNASGDEAQRYVAVLRGGSPSEFFRPDGWQLAGADEATALFAQVVAGTLRLGVLGNLGDAPQADWSAGTVLGFPTGFSGVDKVLTGVNPVYGAPTADSGWFTVTPSAPGDEDCLAGIEMRVLHWGDLTIAFRKANTSEGLEGELLWSWVVGDLRGSGFDSFREPTAAPAGIVTGLRTEDGFGVGTSIDELRAGNEVVLSDSPDDDGTRTGTFVPTTGTDGSSFRGVVVDADGTLVGFGTTQSFC